MKRDGYDRFLTILLVFLILAILGMAGYLTFKFVEKYKINSNANSVIAQFDELIDKRKKEENINNNNGTGTTNEVENVGETVAGITGSPLYMSDYSVEGKLEMPSVNLQYPVLSEMTDANAIEVSLAVQYGVGLNNVGNTVIIGHNYRNGLFFGSNKRMQVGDVVYVTDWNSGERIAYEIYDKFTADESDTSYYNRDTNGYREISLVTCEYDNNYRLVILAREQ